MSPGDNLSLPKPPDVHGPQVYPPGNLQRPSILSLGLTMRIPVTSKQYSTESIRDKGSPVTTFGKPGIGLGC